MQTYSEFIDAVDWLKIMYIYEFKRKRDYLSLCRKVKKLKKAIPMYPTKLRATYETYLLFDELKREHRTNIRNFKYKEFRDLYKFERCTYRYINKIYGGIN